ncbi:MAG TPA: NAD-dependent epimerase/dehydratase family protein [Gemmatimonadaceae bacterium]|nr:NAD-dependent epimerase/dehydratase family protein [Gemmatimonadaceae bacterium]
MSFASEAELEEALSAPSPALLDALRTTPGDILVLGAAGKMGPTLARMARRAVDALGRRDRVIAASRFSSAKAEQSLRAAGIETIKCNLLDRAAVTALPDAPNVIFMAGQKFGTRDAPSSTWAMNVVLPSIAAERYETSRIVAFSTGNVYALSPVRDGGSREGDAPAPVGEYAMSCLGRERVFEDAAARRETPVAIVRLNYAVDLRYGVLVDIASRVLRGDPVDLRMGHVNVIWQGDANDWALRCLGHASAAHPFIVNVTGRETLAVREIAALFGAMFGRAPIFTGAEAPDALLSNATLAHSLFGPPSVSTATLLEWVASWLLAGHPLLGKPTHFEERTGAF